MYTCIVSSRTANTLKDHEMAKFTRKMEPCAGCEHRQHCRDTSQTCLAFRRFCNFDKIGDARREPDRAWSESFCKSASFSAAEPQNKARTEEIYLKKLTGILKHLDDEREVKVSIASNVWRKGYRDRATRITSRVRRNLAHRSVVTQEPKFSAKGQIRPMVLSPTL